MADRIKVLEHRLLSTIKNYEEVSRELSITRAKVETLRSVIGDNLMTIENQKQLIRDLRRDIQQLTLKERDTAAENRALRSLFEITQTTNETSQHRQKEQDNGQEKITTKVQELRRSREQEDPQGA